MTKLKPIFLQSVMIIAALFVLSSCIFIKPIELTGIESVTIDRIQDGKVDLIVNILIKNPNTTQIGVKNYTITVFYSDIKLGTIATTTGFQLKSATTASYPIPVQIDTKELLKDKKKLFSALLTTGNSFRFQGSIKVGTFLMSKELIIDHETDVEFFNSLLKELGLDSFRSKS